MGGGSGGGTSGTTSSTGGGVDYQALAQAAQGMQSAGAAASGPELSMIAAPEGAQLDSLLAALLADQPDLSQMRRRNYGR